MPRRLIRGTIGVLVAFGIAELATRVGLVNTTFVPHPSTIVADVATSLTDPEFLRVTSETLHVWAVGLAIATVAGVVAGLALGSSEFAFGASNAVIEILRPIPGIALLPLFVLLFGLTFEARMWMVVYGSIWPILYNTIYGVHAVDPAYKEAARSYGSSRVGIALRVSIPCALPFISTGVRIAAGFALVIAIAAELFIGGGLGEYIARSSQFGDMTAAYSAAVVAGLLGVLLNFGLVRIERRAFAWSFVQREARS